MRFPALGNSRLMCGRGGTVSYKGTSSKSASPLTLGGGGRNGGLGTARCFLPHFKLTLQIFLLYYNYLICHSNSKNEKQ